MSFLAQLKTCWREGAVGAGLAILCGLLLGTSQLGNGLRRVSFDLLFFFAPPVATEDVVLVLIDELSAQGLNQNPGPWNSLWSRKLHAQLMRLLTQAGVQAGGDGRLLCRADSPPGKPEEDTELAQAFQNHGKVVLASATDRLVSEELPGRVLPPPYTNFLNVVGQTNWGRADVINDLGVRRHVPETELMVSLPWVAAGTINAPITQQPQRRLEERWVRYYGPARTLRPISYQAALEETNAHIFKDKIVFIGGGVPTGGFGESKDVFRTPYSRWEPSDMAGVEILATMFLNLVNENWLIQLPLWEEIALLTFLGAVFGFGLAGLRPTAGAGVSLVAACLVAGAAILLVWTTRVGWAWMIVVSAQIPCAFLWSTLAFTRRLARAPAQVPQPAPAPGPGAVPEAGSTQRIPAIPDHELVRVIGKGAYGEVWLARNAIGLHRAVKIVYRARFEKPAPFEREYRGMERFMPISMDHPSFLRLLHVGRDDKAGHFYYIMELGDDELHGQQFDAQTYSPKNLSKELHKQGKLPVAECLRIFIPLSSALDHLHQKNLVHRDIKPSNIIFVHGVPKLADIGLVAELRSGPGSFVGTAGFIQLEGPGTAVADIFSLGCVLFESALGDLPDDFSDKPTAVAPEDAPAGLHELALIIQEACEREVRSRYQSAAEWHDDLVQLQAKLGLAG
ncbi:MAG: CHASE2 domain-containing protein [Verrucomicrobia bacterium]|nr:CHASE2 domain-containing protein [Verrucomicrobiota bacterium]